MAFNTHTANVFLPGCLGPVRMEVVLAEDAETALAASRGLMAETCANICDERAAYYEAGDDDTRRASACRNCAEVIRYQHAMHPAQNKVDGLRARIAELENEILELLQGDEV